MSTKAGYPVKAATIASRNRQALVDGLELSHKTTWRDASWAEYSAKEATRAVRSKEAGYSAKAATRGYGRPAGVL